MTAPFDAFYTMWGQIVIFGFGISIAVAALILGAVRSITKDTRHWAILFGSISWLLSLIITNPLQSGMMFTLGTIGVWLSMSSQFERYRDMDILQFAFGSLIIGIIFTSGFAMYDGIRGDVTDRDRITAAWSYLPDKLNNWANQVDSSGAQSSGLCDVVENPNCQDSLQQASAYDAGIFDIFYAILKLAAYIAKVIKFMGLAITAPAMVALRMNIMMAKSSMGLALANIALMLWNLAIVYQVAKFMLAKRGMSGG